MVVVLIQRFLLAIAAKSFDYLVASRGCLVCCDSTEDRLRKVGLIPRLYGRKEILVPTICTCAGFSGNSVLSVYLCSQ